MTFSTQNKANLTQNVLDPTSKVSVVGAGRSGRSAVKLLHALGICVTLHEKDFSKLPLEFQGFLQSNAIPCVSGEHKKEDFNLCDILIPSPGVAISSLIPLLREENPPLIMAETELAWLYCKEIPVLAITGTSGKTTTTSICAAMLEAQGLSIFIGGNIGIPLCDYVLSQITPANEHKGEHKSENEHKTENERKSENKSDIFTHKKADVLVLELSSFQLQTCNLLHPHVAIFLNISENHLDYHADMQEYMNAKMNLFTHQNEDDFAILGEDLKHYAKEYALKAKILFFDGKLKRFPDTKLLGQHNQSNAEAAWQACKIFGVTEKNAQKALREFKPMINRLEHVAEINGVTYINDSKCTTVEALKVALCAVADTNHPICLMAGGKFKGGNLNSLTPFMKNSVKHIALYGSSKEVFMAAFAHDFNITWDKTLKDALNRLQQIVTKNDVVLLAPATSSFDQYLNYEERGNDFRNTVLALQYS